jgi:hypothetical protein
VKKVTQEVKQLQQMALQNNKAIEVLGKNVEALTKKMAQTPAAGAHPSQVFGLPNVRNGENPMSSRGFSFMKMLGLLTGACSQDQAKVELDVHNRLHNVYVKELGGGGYEYKGGGHEGVHRFLAPLATSYMQEAIVPRDFRKEMKGLVRAGCEGADPDEMGYIRNKQLQSMGYGTKALSWLNELTGGALVAPPEMGELIELLRNKEALVNAGA